MDTSKTFIAKSVGSKNWLLFTHYCITKYLQKIILVSEYLS